MRRFLPALVLLLPLSLNAQGILDFHPSEKVLPALAEAGEPSWTLLHFSDIHGCTENLERIVSFRDAYATYIDDVLHTGDSVTEEIADGNPWARVEGAARFLNTVGNHDARIGGEEEASEDLCYHFLLEPFVKGWNVIRPEGSACYYYKDYPSPGIRLIVLDGMHYTGRQEAWFVQRLVDALDKGLQVVAANHFPAASGVLPLESGFTERDEPLGEEVQHRLPGSAFSLVDAFLDRGGSFVCWLAGHAHQDFVGPVRGHERQFQIMVDKAGFPDWFMEEDRTKGTAFQDSFNLLTVNPVRGIFLINRIGCTEDQYHRGKHRFMYDYRKREVLVNE